MNKWFLILCLGVVAVLHAEEKPTPAPKEKEVLKEESSETTHVLRMHGEEIPYKATAGTLLFKDGEEIPKPASFLSLMSKKGKPTTAGAPSRFVLMGDPVLPLFGSTWG